MDFIARAGSVIDRGHRVIGILLVVIVALFFWINSLIEQRNYLDQRLRMQNNQQSIYVVPNSQSGVYNPREGKLLISTFVDYVMQNSLTYTPVNMDAQYKSIRNFFDEEIRSAADQKFSIEKRKAKIEEYSSIFVLDKTSNQINSYVELKDKRTDYGKKTFRVRITGVRSFEVAGRILSSAPVAYELNIQETQATEQNPFGFNITYFKQTK